MSEKYTYRGSTVYEGGEELSTIDVVDLLNELNEENIIPSALDKNVASVVAAAVIKAAKETSVSRI